NFFASNTHGPHDAPQTSRSYWILPNRENGKKHIQPCWPNCVSVVLTPQYDPHHQNPDRLPSSISLPITWEIPEYACPCSIVLPPKRISKPHVQGHRPMSHEKNSLLPRCPSNNVFLD